MWDVAKDITDECWRLIHDVTFQQRQQRHLISTLYDLCLLSRSTTKQQNIRNKDY